ncbi:hypothetical protein [Corynebacterium cystitidis]|uniref:hypothetical protein n=1 Tax=Corynebacterium cystitidis TaxID=35757 RepID=UPI00211DE46F|nr:hypothetical protein [Corynebacterium cystitidis]
MGDDQLRDIVGSFYGEIYDMSVATGMSIANEWIDSSELTGHELADVSQKIQHETVRIFMKRLEESAHMVGFVNRVEGT